MRCTSTALAIALLLLAAPAAEAYEGGAVSNGGAITGTIRVADASLTDGTLKVTKDESFCGQTVPAEKHLVAGGKLQNAVVMLRGIASGKVLDKEGTFTITNKQCQFVPHVMVAPKGAMMKVRNDDPVLHNSHFYLMRADAKKKNVINLALPKQGVEIGKKKILRKSGLLSVQCDAHEFMQGWLWVVDNPYAVVTKGDGKFELSDVPPGTYEIVVWHESLGEKTSSVTVKAGKTASADVSY